MSGMQLEQPGPGSVPPKSAFPAILRLPAVLGL